MFIVNLISFHKLNQRMFPFYFVTAIHINTGAAFKLNILHPVKLNYDDNTTSLTKKWLFKREGHDDNNISILLYILY